MLGFILGVVIAASPTPFPQARAVAACPREPPRVIEESNLTLTPEERPTNAHVRFALDLGSDGRLRRAVLVESSGDSAIDAAAAQALKQFRFAAPTFGCVSVSANWSWYWRFPDEVLATATPAASAAPASSPAPSASTAQASCTAPFVRLAWLPIPSRREQPGTATVDVTLDADARVKAVHLVHPSGHFKTDYAATVAARNGNYIFESIPGCPSGPTVYRLELTFR